jgi:hypothetical protein
MTTLSPPGWYDDPDGSPNAERRWDGQGWTPERRRKNAQVPPLSYPQAGPALAYPLPAQPSYPQPGPPPAYPPFPPHPPYPPFPPHPPYPQPTSPARSNLFSIIGLVCAGIAVLFLPVLFGPAGLILGAIGWTKKESWAPIAVAAAAGCMIAGMVLGMAVWSSFYY